jgi:sarcosine oxidase
LRARRRYKVNRNSGSEFDLIVVGLGAMGAAALHHAAAAGHKVLGIDRFDPPHNMGSSHAETRITRLAIGEGPEYLPFVARSHEIWRELETRSGKELFYQTGGYTIAPRGASSSERWGDFVNVTAQIAADNNIEYDLLTPDEFMARQPNLIVGPQFRVGFEPSAGLVLIEETIRVQLAFALESGATIVTKELVETVEPDGSGVTVRTASSSYRGTKAVVTAGPWLTDLVPAEKPYVEVYRQTVVWFEVEDPEPFTTDNFSYVMWPGHTVEDYLALWPTPPGSAGLKAMRERFDQPCHPDSVDRSVSEEEIAELYERYIHGKVLGVKPTALQSAVCLYSGTPDEKFLIDYHPESENVMFASACSGHGFKHSTALSEAMVTQLMGSPVPGSPTGLSLAPFGRDRFGN